MSATELPAGRELDALVAERLFGGRWEPAGSPRYKVLVVDGHVQANRHRETGVLQGGMLPCYSVDIAAAWQVVERLGLSVVQSEDGWYALKPQDIEHGNVRGTDYPRFTLVGREGQWWEPADTAPLAICRAALAAMEAA